MLAADPPDVVCADSVPLGELLAGIFEAPIVSLVPTLATNTAFTPAELIAAQQLVRRMPVGDRVVEAILDLVRACRPGEPEALPVVRDSLAWGPGPRAAQALMLTVRARALLNGRLAPGIDDVAALARPVLSHRMALTFAARARGETLSAIIARAVTEVLGTDAEAAA